MSEDQPILFSPLHFAKPETNLETFYVIMFEASEVKTQPENFAQMNIASDDNNVAMEVSEAPSSTNMVTISQIHSSSISQPLNIQPHPTLTSNLVLQAVCKTIFDSLEELVEARNRVIHLVNYLDKWNNLRNLVDKTLDDL